ncbi:TPR repeat [Fimbriiglobus ruber]|uniref:TPR repeat n=1 Tax=Fimbriiglobus ruber TaxID=1908690 RepID=A0A225DC48_9BACT|nr:TPR repeat [Fimbriiglobus ruber]
MVAAVRTVRDRVLEQPRSGEAWGSLAEVFLANDLDEEGRICSAEAEHLQPDDPRWPYFQGIVLANRGEREAAIPHLVRAGEKSEKVSKGRSVPHLALAETLLAIGRTDEAEESLRRAASVGPDDPRVQFDSGLLAVARDGWAVARDRFVACLGSPFARRKARIQLAAVYRRLGETAKAEEARSEAGRMPPDADWPDPFVTEYLRRAVRKMSRYKSAESLEAQGRLAEAIRVAEPMTAEFPDDDLPQLMLGRFLAQTGDFDRAERALRRALRLAPDKIQTHYLLGLLLQQRGERSAAAGDSARAAEAFQEGIALSRRALVLKPDYGFAHMALGLLLKQSGDKAEALSELREAVRCNPEYAEIHLQLAELLVDLGHRDEAVPRYERALLLAPPGSPWIPTAAAKVKELKNALDQPGKQ